VSLTRAPLTIALLVINWIVFGVGLFLPSSIPDPNGFGPLILAGAIIPQAVAAGEYYRIVTAGFLHFGIMHIAFNSYALAQAGMVVENIYGSARFIIIYFIALIAGGVLAFEMTIGTGNVTAGASGAIMGLFGAMAAFGLKTPQLRRALVGWAAFPIVATLAYGFANPQGVSNAGHIGGVIAGAIAGFLIPPARMLQRTSRQDD
jgi:rhomboid protease GluP